LQLEVRTNGGASYTVLAPRQQLMPTPYAIFASSAGGAGISGTIPASALGNAWRLSGNSNTISGQFLGTTDDQPFDVRVNNVRVMRYRLNNPGGIYTNAPSIIGGSSVNSSLTGVVGATIAGGGGVEVSGSVSVGNEVHATFGTVGGGVGNVCNGMNSTIAGGYKNICGGDNATLAGGIRNIGNGDVSAIGGGGGNVASGRWATVPGGSENEATAELTFAAGNRAKADRRGSFVWADASDADFHPDVTNQFCVRCTGGARFVADPGGGAGVRLFPGDTSWTAWCDRNSKKNFSAVNAEAILEKLAAMPVQSWNYKWESDTNTPHLGPMAQDFKAAFYPGRDDKSISTLEFDGVALAAIQGLNQKLEERDARIHAVEKELSEIKRLLSDLVRKGN
jgi:hypothetical protein